MLFFYFSCDDAGIAPKNQDYCITGQISNWSGGEKTLHAYLRNSQGGSFSIANCPIDASGNFNLCLPASVPDSALYTSDSIFYMGCSGGTVNFNPPDVRGSEISSFKVKDNNTVVGYIRNNNYDTLYAGAFSLMYLWVNKDVSVSGTKYCTSDTLIFDGSAVSGWNKVVKHYTAVSGFNYTIVYNTSEPLGGTWKYTSY